MVYPKHLRMRCRLLTNFSPNPEGVESRSALPKSVLFGLDSTRYRQIRQLLEGPQESY